MKIQINGVILILSCQKYKNSRLKEFKLNKLEYENWKVVYVIGDFFLQSEYIYEQKDSILYLKCEDSYLHLLKKLGLALKYLYEMFEIKEGILRCGDDLIFNENKLVEFLKVSNKADYFGKAYVTDCHKYIINEKLLQKSKIDYFMYDYYMNHLEDFDNPQHNLKDIKIENYLRRPDIAGAVGTLYYLSNYSVQIFLQKMDEIKYNIFHFDEYSQSYPYIIEDVAMSYILYLKKIPFTHSNNIVDDHCISEQVIAYHTNKYT